MMLNLHTEKLFKLFPNTSKSWSCDKYHGQEHTCIILSMREILTHRNKNFKLKQYLQNKIHLFPFTSKIRSTSAHCCKNADTVIHALERNAHNPPVLKYVVTICTQNVILEMSCCSQENSASMVEWYHEEYK